MNAAVKNQTLDRGEGYCQFGFTVLGKLLKGFESYIAGVIENTDVECVHKMRVSSRRIRAVMPLFKECYPKKKYKRWLKEIKTVTKLLSEARDLDVQTAFLQDYIQKSHNEHQALMPLLKHHKNCRKTVQATVTKGLEKLQSSGTLKEINDYLKQATHESSNDPLYSLILEKACKNITCMLDDLLSLSRYVHEESASLKHHEMRIKAKHLRYTMETFASLYKNGLEQEIGLMKGLQDLLGEMHDCEVWLGILSKFTIDQPEKGNQKKPLKTVEFKQAANAFSMYVTEHKKSNYACFVKRWDEAMSQNFFSNLQETVNAAAGLDAKKLDSALLLNPNVKVAVLSDIHANLHALETVIQDAHGRGAQVFLNAGDSIGYGAFPNEVLQVLHNKGVLSVCGNFDAEVLKGSYKGNSAKKVAIKYAKKTLTKPCTSYIQSFPAEFKQDLAGKKVFMTHASPLSPTEHLTHDTPDARLKQIASEVNADLFIIGHSHEQFLRQLADVSFLNPGSVGRPSDGNPQTAYAFLTFDPFRVELFRLDYPVEAAAEALRKKGLPESFSQMLLRGVPLDVVVNGDKAKKDGDKREWAKVIQAAHDFSKSYLQDNAHLEQVRELALNLFDNLKVLHRLGDYERGLLECAALLHDIGLSKGIKGHNKTSMNLILNDTTLPLTSDERRIVASLARYHRKGLPKQKHYNLATLNSKTINTIWALSGILRVADAFDYLHNNDVKLSTVKIAPKKVTLECFSSSDASLIEQAFDKKKDLFEKHFKKKVTVAWVKQ
ncbi:MAG: YfcE family phosphodiesterase [Candidatus Bathyarchaeia archaeon]|jgi:putative phosphoesterase